MPPAPSLSFPVRPSSAARRPPCPPRTRGSPVPGSRHCPGTDPLDLRSPAPIGGPPRRSDIDRPVPKAVPIPEARPCTCTSPRKGNALVKTRRVASYAHVLSPWLAAEPTVAGMIPRYNPLAPNSGIDRATSLMVAPGMACRRVFSVSTGCIMKVDTPDESPPARAVFNSSSLVPVRGGVRGSMVADSYHSSPGSEDSLSGGKRTRKLRNWP
eukprot:scaffold810_cov355-Pavlova_lutheri.AAC.32